MEGNIRLVHGDGGKYTSLLLKEIFYKHFENDMLVNSLDACLFKVNEGNLAYTTDSFVVKPLIFPGGDIGKLAVCGTINDLVVSGAMPLYLSCGFIIEEGFSIIMLETIVKSMGEVLRETGVKIITGDTKVVEKGAVDGLFINTSGIGVIKKDFEKKEVNAGDKLIITGGIGEHGTTIAVERNKLNVAGNLKSDCMPMNKIIEQLIKYAPYIKLMKDPTRGGLATAMNEISEYSKMGIHLIEEKIPIKKEVLSVNQLLGLDPLYMASEGRMIIAVDKNLCEEILHEIKKCEGFEDSAVIGDFFDSGTKSIVFIETLIGGKRIVRPLEGDMLPRIC
jgi:hydrogenase expression/formation protein HypE